MKWFFVGCAFAIGLMWWYGQASLPTPAEGIVQLVWVTDANPAREAQAKMFAAWHQRTYGEPIAVKLDFGNGGRYKNVMHSLAGTGPDLFDIGGIIDLERYVKSGIILDVTEQAEALGFSRQLTDPALWPCFVFQGRQYAFPTNANGFQILYHRDLFRQAGVPEPKGPWSWQEFRRVAKQLTRNTAKGQQWGVLQLDPLDLFYASGARMFSADGTRCVADSPQAVEALTFYHELRVKDHVMPTPTELANHTSTGGWGTGAINQFLAKRYAMTRGARWMMTTYAQEARQARRNGIAWDYDLGVAPMPGLQRPYVVAQSRATGINRKSRQVQYALRFLQFLASEEYNHGVNAGYDAVAAVTRFNYGPQGIAQDAHPPKGLEAVNDPLWREAVPIAHDFEYTPFIPPYRVQALWLEGTQRLDAGLCTPRQMLRDFTALVTAEMRRTAAQDPALQRLLQQAHGEEARP